jgi:hypothetical protein
MANALDIHPKVAGGTISSALTLIIVWVASYWVTVPTEPAIALSVVLGFVGGWLTPPGPSPAP